MEASRVCQADKHDKEREALVPCILTGEKSMRNRGGLRDRVKIFSVATLEEHLTSENSHLYPCSNYWKDPKASLKFHVPHDWDPTVPSSYWAELIRPVEPMNNVSD
ncbi:hypothetical protein Tco_1448348 [Tanacetum coccineum]